MGHDGQAAASAGLITVTAWVVLLVLVTVILKTLAFLFIPLSVSLLFCYALGLPLDFLERLKLSPFLRIVVVILFVVVLFYLLGRLVHANLLELQVRLPEFEATFWGYTRGLLACLGIGEDEARRALAAFVDNFRHADLQPLGGVVQQLSGSFFAFLGNVFWVMLFMVFILAEREGLAKRLASGLGEAGPLSFWQRRRGPIGPCSTIWG